MGYRSDVSYLILFPDEAQYHAFLTTARTLSNQPIVNDEITHINGQKQWGDMTRALGETVHGVNMYKDSYLHINREYYAFPAIAFKAEDVKWYENYEDVHGHESLLALARIGTKQEDMPYSVGTNTTSNMTPCTYDFLRVGEDDDDVERRHNGHHVALSMHPMRMNRSIYHREPMRAMFDDVHREAMQSLLDKEDV
jgi:hypothetical protein